MVKKAYEDHLGVETQPVIDKHLGPGADSMCFFCPVGRFVEGQVGVGRRLFSRVLALLPSFKKSARDVGDLGSNGDVMASEKFIGSVKGELRPYKSRGDSTLVTDFNPYKTPYSSWDRAVK